MDRRILNLFERNNEIEKIFNQKLKDFNNQIEYMNKEIEKKEQQIDKLRKLFLKEKRQYVSSRLSNQESLEKNKQLTESISDVKQKIKNVYQKIDQNNERLNNVVDIIQDNKQVGSGPSLNQENPEKQLLEYLGKIEDELKENIRGINFVENELKGFLSGKDVELEKVSQTLDQLIIRNDDTKNSDEIITKKNFDEEAEKIIKNINAIENKISL